MERVGPSRHGLGLQHRLSPALGQLPEQRPGHVGRERDLVHHAEPTGLRFDLDRSPVAPAVHTVGTRSGKHDPLLSSAVQTQPGPVCADLAARRPVGRLDLQAPAGFDQEHSDRRLFGPARPGQTAEQYDQPQQAPDPPCERDGARSPQTHGDRVWHAASCDASGSGLGHPPRPSGRRAPARPPWWFPPTGTPGPRDRSGRDRRSRGRSAATGRGRRRCPSA